MSEQEVPYSNLDDEKSTVRRFVSKQSLSSVLNSPTRKRSRDVPVETIPAAKGLPNIELSHFLQYAREQTQRDQALASVRNTTQLLEHKEQDEAVDAKSALQNLQKEVPPLFFGADFQFHDPEVLEYIIQTGWNAPNLQQEKFSHYLDLVEVELLRQISTQSNAFFSALSRLHHLRDEVVVACDQINNLRRSLKGIDQSTVQSLHVVNILQRQKNIDTVHSKLALIKKVKEAQPTVQLLLSNNDFIGALDLIEQTQNVLTKELNGVQCLRHVGFQLSEMVNVIARIMQEEFVRIATDTSNCDIELIALENQLSPAVVGLMHLHKMHIINEEYSTRAVASIQSILQACKKDLIQANTSESSVKQMDNVIKDLSASKFIEWIENDVSEVVLKQLQQASNVRHVLENIIHAITHSNSSEVFSGSYSSETMHHLSSHIKESYCEQVMTDNQNTLLRLCEAGQKEISNLLQIRADYSAKMQLTDFTLLYNFVQLFIEKTEKFTHRQCLTLRGTLASQGKKFATTFHHTRMSTIALILDNENWTQAEVAQEFQDIVDSLYDAPREASHTSNKGVYFVLRAEGEEFAVVNSALMFLNTLSEYLQVVEQIPSLAYDMLNNLTEILKLWNSRTCQLVLGAGAMAMANLKSITATNLVLSSRCLRLIEKLIPQLKKKLSVVFVDNKRVLLNALDKIIHDYAQHYTEIIEKLKSIVKSRIDVCCQNLSESDIWKDSSPNPSEYMVKIYRAGESLHKILFRLCSEHDLQDIFSEILALYNSSLVEYFSSLRLNNTGKKRLYHDITYLIENLSKLTGIADQVTSLNVLLIFYESQFGKPLTS